MAISITILKHLDTNNLCFHLSVQTETQKNRIEKHFLSFKVNLISISHGPAKEKGLKLAWITEVDSS